MIDVPQHVPQHGRMVFKPTNIIRPDVPGYDYRVVFSVADLEAALADGWYLERGDEHRPDLAAPPSEMPSEMPENSGTLPPDIPRRRGRPRKMNAA